MAPTNLDGQTDRHTNTPTYTEQKLLQLCLPLSQAGSTKTGTSNNAIQLPKGAYGMPKGVEPKETIQSNLCLHNFLRLTIPIFRIFTVGTLTCSRQGKERDGFHLSCYANNTGGLYSPLPQQLLSYGKLLHLPAVGWSVFLKAKHMMTF